MIGLVKNEIIKILYKKTIWIMLIIAVVFISFISFLYTKNFYETSLEDDPNTKIKEYQEHIDDLDYTSANYYTDLANYAAMIDSYELLNQYNFSSWQKDFILNSYKEVAEECYNAEYAFDNERFNICNEKKDRILNILDENNWRDYIYLLQQTTYENIEIINERGQTLVKDEDIKDNEKALEYQNTLLFIYNYRLENNVEFDDSFLDKALKSLQDLKYRNLQLIDDADQSIKDEIAYEILRQEYIIENKIDIDNYHSLKSLLESFFDEYSFLIIIFIILISGTIFSEEFQKGTIKSILLYPVSRNKIFFAKYFSTIIFILGICLFLLFYQFIIGGIIFGFNSIHVPVIVYNYTMYNIEVIGLLKYIIIIFTCRVIYYAILGTIAFALSIITCNSVISIALSFLGIIFSPIINNLIIKYNIVFMKYCIFLNWDFTQYLFGAKPQFKNINLTFSILICILHLIALIEISRKIFKSKKI